MATTLVRFVIAERHEASGCRDGFFRTAYRLRNQHRLPTDDHEKLALLLSWFGANLNVPKRFYRSRSKGAYGRNARGISWFKESAVEQISKAQQIATLLRKNGYEVYEVRTSRPGFVVFADDHQVVAEPFSDVAGLR